MLEYSMHWHNAAFMEVKVDEDLVITQVVTRVVNTVDAGCIINPKTTQSQPGDWRHRVGHQLALMEEVSTTTSAAT